MQKLALALLVSLALVAPSFATEPGTPMDCSDLELAPEFTCTQETQIQDFGFGFPFQLVNENLEVDNEARLVTSANTDVLPPVPLPLPLCTNGLDDDGDGRADADDAHCKSDADNDESRP